MSRPALLILPDARAVARRAAAILAEAADAGETIGLAAGATMAPVYDAAVEAASERPALFSRSRFFSLDELAGLGRGHPASFSAFLWSRFLDPAGADPARVRLPRGDAPDPEAEAAAYEAGIADAGGIGLQLLGIGRNGHIAFNEPGSSAASRTRPVRLAEETVDSLRPAFPTGQAPPGRGITMGVATILEARRILLVATGAAKADAVAAALDGPVTPACPASFLRLHADATFLCDAAAAARLAAQG